MSHTNNTQSIKVWDIGVRSFHWVLVFFFVLSYATGEEESWVHVWSGYAIVALLLIRIVWGFIGTRHARFSDFVYGPGEVKAYAKGLMTGRAKRYIGHNPLGGLMVLALIFSLGMTTFTGMALYGVEEGKGPLAGVVASQDVQLPQLISTAQADDDEHGAYGEHGDGENEVLEETHEFFANFTVLLILLHIAGVIFESLFHRENLVKAMVDGHKDVAPDREGDVDHVRVDDHEHPHRPV